MLFNIQVAKINTVESFDETKLPVASRNFVIEYGIRQWLADSHAQIKRLDFGAGDTGDAAFLKKVREKVTARVTALRTGVGLPGGSAVDPIRVKQAEMGLSDEEMALAMAQFAKTKKAA